LKTRFESQLPEELPDVLNRIELVALAPDVVLATAGSIVGAFQQASRHFSG
jgi:hypothetical protein